MLPVEGLSPIAEKRLVTLHGDTEVKEAARLLGIKERRLVVICDDEARMIGVIARRDIVREVSHCLGCACTMRCRSIMTTEVIACRPHDSLAEVWRMMTKRSLRSVPIVDGLARPLGIAAARDIAQLMLSEAEYDQSVMQEYVMGVGYR